MLDASGCPIHFSLVRSTDATTEPISTEDLKLTVKIDTDADNALMDAYVKAARQQVEIDSRRALITQAWTMTLDQAPANRGAIWLPIYPVISITSIKSFSTADAESTVATSVYRLDASSLPARIVLKDAQDWPTGLRPQNALQIIFSAGYGAAASDISDTGLLQAARLLAAHWYRQREPIVIGESVSTLPLAYDALIAPHRVPWL